MLHLIARGGRRRRKGRIASLGVMRIVLRAGRVMPSTIRVNAGVASVKERTVIGRKKLK